jgi:hypothetical protein
VTTLQFVEPIGVHMTTFLTPFLRVIQRKHHEVFG